MTLSPESSWGDRLLRADLSLEPRACASTRGCISLGQGTLVWGGQPGPEVRPESQSLLPLEATARLEAGRLASVPSHSHCPEINKTVVFPRIPQSVFSRIRHSELDEG